MSKKVIVFSAGGTGGHIYPALNIANKLREHDKEIKILFIGTGNNIEKKLITDFELIGINSKPFLGQKFLARIRLLFSTPLIIISLIKTYLKIKPSIVIGFGGYPSFFPVMVAKFLGIPTILHEQNAKIGTANKILKIFADTYIHSLAIKEEKSGEKAGDKTGHKTGDKTGHKTGHKAGAYYLANPIKEDFFKITPPSLNSNLKILIIGGSQGARSLNTIIIELFDLFKSINAKVVHQVGKTDIDRCKALYEKLNNQDFSIECLEYLEDIKSYYESSNLIISRAGAMSTSEISATGRAAIYIPLPIASGHQKDNVKKLEGENACFIIDQNEETKVNLSKLILELNNNQKTLLEVGERAKTSLYPENKSTTDKFVEIILSSVNNS